jgi:4-carboxymuconolactone decarboxylase
MVRAKGRFTVILVIAAGIVIVWAGTMPSPICAQGTPAAKSAPAMKEVPKDVYPESGSRSPLVNRENMDEYGKKIYDKCMGSTTRALAGSLGGPSGNRLHSPVVADLLYDLSQYLRFKAGLSGQVRELAILVTARELDNAFEWAAHEGLGLKEGISKSVIDVVKYRKPVAGLSETEAVVIQLGRQIFEQKKVDSETYARALKIFGDKNIVDLVTLIGHYASTAVLVTAFDHQIDEKNKKYVLPKL